MKKYSLLIIVLLSGVIGFSQNMENNAPIKTDLPAIIPPSPTVAALMKFEEIPVNNYTGVPDISIPLFSTPTLSKDVNLDISLKYHIAGVAAAERAGDTGLGWSLFAGGTISRTVMDLPDEYYKAGLLTNKVGIYHTYDFTNSDTIQLHKNFYYQLMENFSSGTTYSDGVTEYRAREFLWEKNEKGKYDAEHDLWQYNFMGHTGRFIIRKNTTTNVLEVVSIDDNRLKIINHYDSDYVPTYFEVYDEKGYKFVFDVVETTSSTNSLISTYSGDNVANLDPEPTIYKSAFHLSGVFDANNKPLIGLEYYNDSLSSSYREATTNKTGKTNELTDDYGPSSPDLHYWEPMRCENWLHQITNTKKLKTITINGFGTVDFSFAQGREDTNLDLKDQATFLSNISIKNYGGSQVKGYDFNYMYSIVQDKRMFLESIDVYGSSTTKLNSYVMEYKTLNLEDEFSDLNIGQDYWGYFNRKACSFRGNTNDYREVDPSYNDINILQKMKLPTGGSIIFNYETNDYSYLGDVPAEDYEEFPEIPSNHYEESIVINSAHRNGNNYITYTQNGVVHSNKLHYSNEKQYVLLTPTIFVENDSIQDKVIWLWKKDTVGTGAGTFTKVLTVGLAANNPEGCVNYELDAGYQYIMTVVWMNGNDVGYGQLDIKYTTTKPASYKRMLGGGSRIRKIGYFKDDVSKDYYSSSSAAQPDKEVSYSYGIFGQNRSSGSLVYSKPRYYTTLRKRPCCHGSPGFPCATIVANYKVYSDYNLNPSYNTQGSCIGYKNVSISETNNGRTDYEYTSPIDFPEDVGNYFENENEDARNYDYKRGLLVSERKYDNSNRILRETLSAIIDYDYEEEDILMGLKTFYRDNTVQNGEIVRDCPISVMYREYKDYLNMLYHCIDYPFHKPIAEECPSSSAYQYGGATMGCFDPAHPNAAGAIGLECCKNAAGAISFCHGSYNIHFNTCNGFCYTGDSFDFIGYTKNFKVKGWAKLRKKTILEHFYEGTNHRIVQTEENYDYNPVNKQISEQTVTNSLGETLKTKYYYLSTTDNNTISENNISTLEKVETFKDNTLLSTNHITYVNNFPGNTSYLPSTIESAKGADGLESRVRFTKYDTYGHPLEVLQENGTLISYIWGYNDSQPIAKIENARYGDIDTNLMEAAISNSNLVGGINDVPACQYMHALSPKEHELLLNLLDIQNSLPNAMVTAYTYKPLLGVTSVTDPKGHTTYYSYDSFGRLSAVMDADGNLLSENEYHYKN